VETESGKLPPYGTDYREHPRVCRLRDLLGRNPDEVLVEIKNCRRGFVDLVMSSDGNYFAVVGIHDDDPDPKRPAVQAYATSTGKELWSPPIRTTSNHGLRIDSTGKIMTLWPEGSKSLTLVEMPSRQLVGTVGFYPTSLSPGNKYQIVQTNHPSSRVTLLQWEDRAILVNFDIDSQSAEHGVPFDAAGSRVAWGNKDGTVIVCDLNEVNRQLATMNLGW